MVLEADLANSSRRERLFCVQQEGVIQSTVYTAVLLSHHTRVDLFSPALNDDSMERISALHIDQTQQLVASLSGPSLTVCTGNYLMLRGSSWGDVVHSGALPLSGLAGLLSCSELMC